MDKAPTSDAYGEVQTIGTIVGRDVSITPEELVAHMRRVETLAVVLRDVLLAMADVPPFSMMVSAEQKKMLKAL